MKCALVGDFNAKTAVLEDFSEPDETFMNVMDVNVEDDLFRYCYDYQVTVGHNVHQKTMGHNLEHQNSYSQKRG
jgi:hypothetical protein